jgi:hypothetical protein
MGIIFPLSSLPLRNCTQANRTGIVSVLLAGLMTRKRRGSFHREGSKSLGKEKSSTAFNF